MPIILNKLFAWCGDHFRVYAGKVHVESIDKTYWGKNALVPIFPRYRFSPVHCRKHHAPRAWKVGPRWLQPTQGRWSTTMLLVLALHGPLAHFIKNILSFCLLSSCTGNPLDRDPGFQKIVCLELTLFHDYKMVVWVEYVVVIDWRSCNARGFDRTM